MSTPVNYQCDPNNQPSGQIGRGVTTWELSNAFQIDSEKYNWNSQNAQVLTFTCTVPKCYSGKDSCNITFNAYANDNNNLGQDIELDYFVNGQACSGCHISGQQGRGGWQSFDISLCSGYNDTIENTFAIYNNSSSAVTIQYFRILRIYKMCTLYTDQTNQCNNPGMCESGTDTGSNGALDYVRVDKPCNYESCGTWSVTTVADTSHEGQTLQTQQSFDWYFDFSNCSGYNYEHGVKCLFNFNNMWAASTSNNNDVKLDAYINGQYLTSYYLSKQVGDGMFPSFDLMLNNTAYNDTGYNHVQLVNRSDVGVTMSPTLGGINIYRVYQTGSVCGCQQCQTCYGGQGCWPCYGFCQTCVTPCQLCESGYNWCELCESGYTWPCEICESQCYTSCYACQPCEGCQSCVTCQPCEGCQACEVTCQPCEGCQTCVIWQCQPCYDCQACYSCEPSCYDYQICYACQVTCFDCERCYAYY